PELTRFLVAQVKSLAGGITDRIVVPGGETKLVGIVDPGVGGSAFRNDRSDVGVCEEIDPGRGSGLSGSHANDIFPAIVGESSDAVEEDEFMFAARIGGGGQRRS